MILPVMGTMSITDPPLRYVSLSCFCSRPFLDAWPQIVSPSQSTPLKKDLSVILNQELLALWMYVRIPPSPVIFEKTPGEKNKVRSEIDKFKHVPLNQVCLIFKGPRTKGGAIAVTVIQVHQSMGHPNKDHVRKIFVIGILRFWE